MISSRFPPSAYRVEVFACADPRCTHVHALLYDEAGLPIAQMAVDAKTVDLFQRSLYQRSTERAEAGAGFQFTEEQCPGHVASKKDPKVCGLCGTHIDSMRPPE